MKLQVLRFMSLPDVTFGKLYEVRCEDKYDTKVTARIPLAYTLEDEYRIDKVSAETRIPAGTYEIQLRTEGGHHGRYSKKFPEIHEGMLWIRHVPGFKWILIHIGNTESDTAGCLLVGDQVDTQKEMLLNSTKAYKRVYVHILEAMKRGEKVEIEYVDYDSVA